MVTYLTAENGKMNFYAGIELNNNNLSGTITYHEATHSQMISGSVNDNGLKFYSEMRIYTDGQTQYDTSRRQYHITNASKVMIAMGAETNYLNDYPTYRDVNKDLVKEVQAKLNNLSLNSYTSLKEAHLDDYQSLFHRVELDLNSYEDIPTDELVKRYRNKFDSPYLEVLAYQYGRYLSIAGSRGSLPSNLVGLWTIGDSAWTGDYHFNVNVQMNYWPIYTANLAEIGETMVAYMESLREPGRLTAERVHGIENATSLHNGFTVHTENNPFGMTAPSNSQEYGWNPTGAAWAIQNLWAHYEYTQDETYLKEVIYPIIKEATLFWDNYLWESSYQKIDDENSPYDGQNRLVVAPSFSAEQGPTVNGSTYDQSLVWELYKEAIAAGTIVGEDQKLLDAWQERMNRLDPINLNATGGIKEWYEETRVGLVNGHHKAFAQAGNLAEVQVPNSGWNIGHPGEHRHASHLVGLYPGTLIQESDEAVFNAAIVSLTERDVYSTGWSKANKVNLWARAKDGEKAHQVLKNLIGGNASGLQYNLFDSHGSQGGDTMMTGGNAVWQIDGNFGLSAGVNEMLLQSHQGYVEFLPALPSEWTSGHVNGLKARGNFTINQNWAHGFGFQFEVINDNTEAKEFIAKYPSIEKAKVLCDGQVVSFTVVQENQISFMTQPNKVYTIDLSDQYVENLVERAKEYKQEDYTQTSHYQLRKALNALLQAQENGSVDENVLSSVEVAMTNLKTRKSETIISLGEMNKPADWYTSGMNGYYCISNTGSSLTQTFNGNGVSFLSVKGNDHGIMRIEIFDENNQSVYVHDYDLYASSRMDITETIQLEKVGTYRMEVSYAGRNASSRNGWIEIGPLTVYSEHLETVDYTALNAAIKKADWYKGQELGEQSAKQLAAFYPKAIALKTDPTQTCTLECDDVANELLALCNQLVYKASAVTNLQAQAINYKTITLSWDENDGNISAYNVYRKAWDSDEFKLVAKVKETTYQSIGVMTGKEYQFKVTPVSSNDKETMEGMVSNVVIGSTSLMGKVKLAIEQVSTAKFKLSWNAIDGATRYIVYRKRNDDKMKKVLTLGSKDLEYTTAELPFGDYQFVLKAGRYDSKDRVMTKASNTVKGSVVKRAPSINLTAGSKLVKVSWKAMEGVTHYQVYRATSENSKYSKLITTTNTSYTAKSLKTGKEYFFKVCGYKTYKSGDDLQYIVYTPYSTVKKTKVK